MPPYWGSAVLVGVGVLRVEAGPAAHIGVGARVRDVLAPAVAATFVGVVVAPAPCSQEGDQPQHEHRGS